MTLPGWPPRDWRALIALAASVTGAATLTLLAAWIVWILWRGGWSAATEAERVDALAKALLGLLFTVAIVLISLGLAINRRSLKASALGASFEASGGDDPSPVAQVTTTTTVSPAAAIVDAQP
jgi:hypothetical protein